MTYRLQKHNIKKTGSQIIKNQILYMKAKTCPLNYWTFFVLLIFLFTSPVRAEESVEDRGPQLSPFLEAEYLYHSGEIKKSQLFYQEYLSRKPGGDRSNTALYRLGTIHQQSRSFATAVRYYKTLLERLPGSLLAYDAKLGMAQCMFELEQYGEAEILFRNISASHPDTRKKWEARIHLGKLDEKRLDYQSAIEKLRKIYLQSDVKDVRNHAKEMIDRIIKEKLGKVMLIGLSKKYSSGFPADQILLRLISIYREERDVEQLQIIFASFLRLFPDHPQRFMIESGLKKIEDNKEGKLRLGVVLPLTGKMALTGQQVLQGVQLAINESGLERDGKLEVVVKDSAARPVEEVVGEFGADPSMIGVIGPVLSGFVKRVVPVADHYRLPVFTPTASFAGLTDLSPYVFRNAMTRKLQGKFIADYAVNVLQLRRFVIVYPLEGYGFELKDTFVREVESLGAEVVSVVGYERSQTDFKKQILEIGGIDDDKLTKLVEDQLKTNTAPPPLGPNGPMSRPLAEMGLWSGEEVESLKVSLKLSYDAIFLPGFYDKVGLIVPQLVFYNVDAATLLGADGWNSPELVKIAGNYMRKGYFVDGFYAQSNRPEVVQFVKQYKSFFAEEPTILSAQSYDVAKMYIQSIQLGAENRLETRDKLLRIRGFQGVSGRTSILPNGEADKNLFTMKIIKKKISEDN